MCHLHKFNVKHKKVACDANQIFFFIFLIFFFFDYKIHKTLEQEFKERIRCGVEFFAFFLDLQFKVDSVRQIFHGNFF